MKKVKRNIFETRAIFFGGNESAMRRRWRKNTVGW